MMVEISDFRDFRERSAVLRDFRASKEDKACKVEVATWGTEARSALKVAQDFKVVMAQAGHKVRRASKEELGRKAPKGLEALRVSKEIREV